LAGETDLVFFRRPILPKKTDGVFVAGAAERVRLGERIPGTPSEDRPRAAELRREREFVLRDLTWHRLSFL